MVVAGLKNGCGGDGAETRFWWRGDRVAVVVVMGLNLGNGGDGAKLW